MSRDYNLLSIAGASSNSPKMAEETLRSSKPSKSATFTTNYYTFQMATFAGIGMFGFLCSLSVGL